MKIIFWLQNKFLFLLKNSCKQKEREVMLNVSNLCITSFIEGPRLINLSAADYYKDYTEEWMVKITLCGINKASFDEQKSVLLPYKVHGFTSSNKFSGWNSGLFFSVSLSRTCIGDPNFSLLIFDCDLLISLTHYVTFLLSIFASVMQKVSAYHAITKISFMVNNNPISATVITFALSCSNASQCQSKLWVCSKTSMDFVYFWRSMEGLITKLKPWIKGIYSLCQIFVMTGSLSPALLDLMSSLWLCFSALLRIHATLHCQFLPLLLLISRSLYQTLMLAPIYGRKKMLVYLTFTSFYVKTLSKCKLRSHKSLQRKSTHKFLKNRFFVSR